MHHSSRFAGRLLCALSCVLSFLCMGCGTTFSSGNSELQPDFTLSLSPGSLSITAGESQNLTVSATASNGFRGSISVALSALPAGVTAKPSTLTLTPGASQAVVLSADAHAAPARGSITLTGVSSSVTHTAAVSLEVTTSSPAGDFMLSVPSRLSLVAGAAGEPVSITVQPENEFSEIVSIAFSGLPSGVTATPSTLNLPAGVSQNVRFAADASAASGEATITITGTSGALVHTAMLTLDIAQTTSSEEFSLSATPANLALTAGSTGQVLSVNAVPINGFSGMVNVSFSGLPSGVTTAPATLSLVPGAPQNVTLTASASAATGRANISVTGKSGSLSHIVSLPLNVSTPPPPPDFSLVVSPTSLAMTAGGDGQRIAIRLSRINNFNGRVDLSLAGLPAGVTANPSTLSLEPGSRQSVTLVAAANAQTGPTAVTFTGTSGSLMHTAVVVLNVAAPPPSADFTLTALPASLALTAGEKGQPLTLTIAGGNGFQSPVAVSISGLPAGVTAAPASLSITPGTPQSVTLTAAANADVGKGAITFTGISGSSRHTAIVALEVDAAPPPPDFTLSVAPQTLSLTNGATGQQVSLSATAKNSFTGTVNVAVSGLPSGVTANPSILSLAPGAPQNMTLIAAGNATAGSAAVTFTGTSASLTHTAALTLTVNATPPPPGVDVTTYHYNNARDGLNANETTLTLANVNSTSFGKIGFFPVDGKVDAEPLYLSQLSVNGATHNVLYVVTEHDTAYAFDADTGAVLWQSSVLQSGETPSDNRGCGQISPEIGITDTPVIDRKLGAIFFVAMTKDATSAYHQRLHALSLTTGAEIQGGPTEITATYPGTGEFSVNGMQVFDPGQYAERVGLLLMNGSIFMGWTSHCDNDPYTGWLMMYNATTLQQTSVLNLTANGAEEEHYLGGEGSIWMAGSGLAGDAQGNIYFLDANGIFDPTLDSNGFPSHGDFGNAFMKVSSANGTLAPADYFSTYDARAKSLADTDLGSGGVLLLPDMTDAYGVTRRLAVGQGKDENFYIVDRDNMGKFNATKNNIHQEIDKANSPEFGMPAYFNGTLYYGGINNVLRAFAFHSAKLDPKATSQTAVSFVYPGTTPGISANGTQNGIVWAIENTSPAVLHAYDASNLATELYNSNQAAAGRDQFGNGNKFITPLIVNGTVFVGTPNGVAVFGLLP